MISVMAVVGTFLLNSVAVYHLNEFSSAMQAEFSGNGEFVGFLRSAADEEDGAEAMSRVLKAYSGNLGIDLYNRNYYVLEPETGGVLAGSSSEGSAALDLTPNILTALTGTPGYARSITASFIDVAIPIAGNHGSFIVYIRDNKLRQQELTSEMFVIILESVLFGLAIAVLLSFLLSKTMTTPIENLTRRAGAIARGEFSGRIESHSNDEIGVLTETFNEMAETLKRTLEAVENERDKLNTLFLRMTDGVCAFDRDGKIIQMNLAAERLLGREYSPDLNYREMFGDLLAFSEVHFMKSQDLHEFSFEVGEYALSVFIAPFGDNDREGGVMAVIHDITEQTKLERVRREFVANVSHELRTPLTNIKSYSETLCDNEDIDRETARNFLGVIMKESDRMTRIVSDLLTLSRYDYGSEALQPSEVSVGKVLQRVYQAMYLEGVKRELDLTLDVAEGIPTVFWDSDKIEQVIVNVVSNAIKYTPDGGKIRIEARREGDRIAISVSDTGVGVPEADLGRIFERFYRVDKARSRAAGGSGLGLTIAKEIVERHGGTIVIQSVYGKGTQVTIRLPVGGTHP